MFKSQKIEIIVNNPYFEYFKKLGYNAIYREKLLVNPNHLPNNSHYKVEIVCDKCGYEYVTEYRQLKNKIVHICKNCKKQITTEKKLNRKQLKKSLKLKHVKKEHTLKAKIIKIKLPKKVKETRAQKIINNPNYWSDVIKKRNENYAIKLKNDPDYLLKINKRKKEGRAKKVASNPNYWSDVIKKRKETCFKKHGDSAFNNQSKKRKTMIEEHGDYYNNNELRQNTLNDKYGSPTFNNQDKKENTCLKKYGVKHTNQDIEVFNKIQKSAYQLQKHNETQLTYRGSYEKHFLDFCYKNNIIVENIKKGIPYFYNNKKRYYFPDFYLPKHNTMIEIKSSYTYNKELDKNLAKKQACLNNDYNFIFIIDKDYKYFKQLI